MTCEALGLVRLGSILMSLASEIGLALAGLGGTLFLAVPWQLLLWRAVGLMAVVGSSLIFLFVLLLWLLAGLLRFFSLLESLLFGLLLWVSAVDKTRTSGSAEVRDIWEIYHKCLEFLPIGSALAIDDALAGRDVQLAWTGWSTAAENALASLGWQVARCPRMVWFLVGGLLCSGWKTLEETGFEECVHV